MMKQVDMYKRAALIAVMGLSLAGCSTVKGWFAGKDAAAKKAQEPAELVKFEPSVKVDKIWSTGVGKGEGHIGVRQRPAVADGKVYAAAITGGVQALDLQTGKHVWEYKPKKEERNDRKFKQRLSGGPGVGEGLVVIGSLSGDVIALNQADGTEKWRAKVPNEVIAAPAIAQNLVLVRSNDGRVTAFDAATGERRWFHAEEGPTLSVRGNAPIVTGPGVVFVGNDSGTLSALALQDGRPLWEQAIGVP
ncbi:outer membrane protein assembly factor BamB, partial [Xanthomonas oryzae pv. oryzae]